MSAGKIRPLIIYQMDPLGNKIGGIQTFIKNFIKYAPDDFEIEFVGVSADTRRAKVGAWQTIEMYERQVNFLPVLFKSDENIRSRIPLSMQFTAQLMRYRHSIDLHDRIVNFHRIEPGIPFALAPCRKVLVVHGNMTDLYNPGTEVKWRRFPWAYFGMEKLLMPGMSKVFVVREDGAAFYKKRYPSLAERFSFLPTWVDDAMFYPLAAPEKATAKVAFLQQQGLPGDTKLALFVGRLAGQKDPLLLLDAFCELRKQEPQTHLLIVGQGNLRQEMEERLRRYGMSKHAAFLGPLTQPEVAGLMRICDVFVMTSAFEGMPISVLEALACGLPVVSTDVGEVRRVIRDELSGLVCHDRMPDTIGGNVARVLREERFSARNCTASIQEYTAGKVLNRMYAAFISLGARP